MTDLHGKHFGQLDEYQQEKITNFDLWVIEIHERNNPDFEPLDLFIRLNNKPYPIKDDTFEMWNSYLDRGLIDTIKASYSNNANWFFMRRTGNRMENENNYTVLSYFKYLEMHPEEGSEKGPLDIYKLFDRISFRLRSKREISKILEDAGKKEAFIEAVNAFEFVFLHNLITRLIKIKSIPDTLKPYIISFRILFIWGNLYCCVRFFYYGWPSVKMEPWYCFNRKNLFVFSKT